MGRKETEFGKLFREKTGYTGKLNFKELSAANLWNEYFKMKSKEKNHSEEHLKEKAERKELRKIAAKERAKERIESGHYLKCYCENYTEIENYDKALEDKFVNWQCHHRLETHFSDGTPRPLNAQLTFEELKALGMYYNRPAEELILMPMKEHRRLHLCGKPKHKKM